MKQNWIVIGAVAAMMAAASTGAGAQMAPPMSPPMSSDAPNYKLLADPLFDYPAIKGAMAKGLSDNQTASVLRIAKLTGMSFRDVLDQVLEGKTFAELAYEHNLKISDVTDPEIEKQQIPAFLAAYESTGRMALKDMPASTDMGMTPTAPMAPPMAATPAMASKDIVQTAMSERRFSTLVGLLKKANLVDTLKGPGPFTVFAPTDAAFRKLPKGTLKNLTTDQLTKILTYHVIPAKVDAATAMAMTSPTSPPTVEGSTLQVTTQNGTVMINDAKVTQADIMATNGIIHAIDTVLMPPDLTTDTAATPAMPAPPPAPGQ
jgi:uncharacterized surface protein with fasciclin (FAS1) repeats